MRKGGYWSWLRLRLVLPDELIDFLTTRVHFLEYYLRHPIRDQRYKEISDLCARAVTTEKMIPGGQMAVGEADFAQIAPYIEERSMEC
jgi:hypothetical protein